MNEITTVSNVRGHDMHLDPALAQGVDIEWGEVQEGTNSDGTSYTYQEGPIVERSYRYQYGHRRPNKSGRGYGGRNRWSTVTIRAQHVLVNGTYHQLHFIGGSVNFKGVNVGFGVSGGPISVGLGVAEIGYIQVTPLEVDGTLKVHFNVFKKFSLGSAGGMGPVSSGIPGSYDFNNELWYSGKVEFDLP